MTGYWNAATRRELIKVYNAYLGISLIATVSARPGQLATVPRRQDSHLPGDQADALLPGAPHPSHSTGHAGQRRKKWAR